MRLAETHPPCSGLQLLDQAAVMLRIASTRAWLVYSCGTVPYALGLIYFWNDMSRSALAREWLVLEAWVLALLYVWMRTCHAVFCARLRDQLAEAPPTGPSPGVAWRRIGQGQCALQAWGLLLLPVAALATLPLGWTVAFFQNVSVLGVGSVRLDDLARRSWRQACLWPGQNHILLLAWSVLAVFVLLNFALALWLAPGMLKMFLGIETVFTRHPLGLLNSTFFLIVTLLTWMSLDPLLKASYVLRCFYGDAIASGADLRLAWVRRARGPVTAFIAGGMGLGLAVGMPFRGDAAEAAAVPSAAPAEVELSPMDAAQLEQRLRVVIAEPEYQWRLPRDRSTPEAETSVLGRAMRAIGDRLSRGIEVIVQWGRRAWEWLESLARPKNPIWPNAGPSGSQERLKWILAGAAVLLTAVVVGMIWQRQRWQPQPSAVVGVPVLSAADLEQDKVLASEHPEEAWWRLASSLEAQGEWRLAVRAIYLAVLASLGRRDWIAIAPHKSNREYMVELGRRGRASDDLVRAFASCVERIDRVWYGRTEVAAEDVANFRRTGEQLREA